MRIIDYDFQTGRLEVRWMWLPTFIGQNTAIMRELEIAGQAKWCGKASPVDEDDVFLARVEEWVIDWLCKRFPIEGLKEYLAGIKHVQET